IQLALGVVLPLTETLPDYQALTQKRPVVLFDVDDEPGWVKTPASEWIRSWIGVPLIKLDEPMGILTINGHHKGMYTQEKANELVAFADQAATAVANAQTFTFLRNAEASYTALFEDSTDMIIIASYQGVILNVNRKACQMLRRSKEMLIGSDITLINPNLKRHLEHESARLKVWQETSLELDVINASGQAIYLELKARQVHYEGKDSVQWVGRDISARKELERIRQDSINMLVHDLRGPLGNLTTVIETLPGWVSEIEDDPAILEILEMANLSGQELRDLVDSLLDVSRLEQGRVPLQRSKVNLTDILSRVKEQVTPRAKNKYMELTINPVPQDVPEVMLDKNMIRRVLINLVDNAIKYTPVNGSISVKTTLTNEGLQIAVSDNGVGISPEDQANIFDKFSRVDHSTKSPAGVGLGLAFCKLATEAHGGTLTIDSSGIAGEGSTFYLTLPLIQPTSEQPS
ncbi:MAG: ATP-binding protein, partial [Chloroflexota bacterium]